MVLTANPLNYWFFLTWCWAASAIIILGTVTAEWRRHIQPLKARDRVLSLLTNFGYLVGTLIRSAITFRPDLPCVWDVWQAPITIGFLSSIYLLRSWRMYFKFELAHERSQMRSLNTGKQISDGHRRSESIVVVSSINHPSTWYSDHRYLISDRFTFAFTSISMLIFFVPNIYVMYTTDYISIPAGDTVKCKLISFMTAWQTSWGIIYLLGLLVLAFKLRKTFDAFGIKLELKAVFMLNVLSWATVAALAGLSILENFYINVFNLRKLAPLIFMMLLFIETTVKPVYRSWEGLEQNVIIGAAANNDINTLTGLLKSPEGFAAFQQYLIGCFCVESCLFWKDIEEYRIKVLGSLRQASLTRSKYLPELKLLLDRAKEINMIYIQEESRLQVNISASQRQRVENAVNNLLVKYESQIDLKDEPTAKSVDISIPVDAGSKTRNSLVSLLSADGPRQSTDGGQPKTPDENADKYHDVTDERIKVADESAINPELKEKFKDILNVFNIAQLEVIELMRTDPYPRFRLTKQFQELVQQFELNQHRMDALRDLNVI